MATATTTSDKTIIYTLPWEGDPKIQEAWTGQLLPPMLPKKNPTLPGLINMDNESEDSDNGELDHGLYLHIPATPVHGAAPTAATGAVRKLVLDKDPMQGHRLEVKVLIQSLKINSQHYGEVFSTCITLLNLEFDKCIADYQNFADRCNAAVTDLKFASEMLVEVYDKLSYIYCSSDDSAYLDDVKEFLASKTTLNRNLSQVVPKIDAKIRSLETCHLNVNDPVPVVASTPASVGPRLPQLPVITDQLGAVNIGVKGHSTNPFCSIPVASHVTNPFHSTPVMSHCVNNFASVPMMSQVSNTSVIQPPASSVAFVNMTSQLNARQSADPWNQLIPSQAGNVYTVPSSNTVNYTVPSSHYPYTPVYSVYNTSMPPYVSNAPHAHERMNPCFAATAAQSHSGQYKDTRLPKFRLPTFSGEGDYDFEEFWSVFNDEIHSRPDLTDSKKFNYLLGCLKGNAHRIIKTYRRTANNYSAAIGHLMKRFGRTDHLCTNYLKQFDDIEPAKNNAKDLRRFLDDIEVIIRSLTVLGRPVDDQYIVSGILKKLPITMGFQLRNLCPNTIQGSSWQLDKLIDTMYRYVDNFETSTNECGHQNLKEVSKRPIGKYNQRPRSPQIKENVLMAGDSTLPLCSTLSNNDDIVSDSELTLTASAFEKSKQPVKGRKTKGTERVISTDNISGKAKKTWNNRTKMPCLYCSNRNHSSGLCNKFTIPEKLTVIEKRKRCKVCLSSKHTEVDCNFTCFVCGKKHHISLCDKVENNHIVEAKLEQNLLSDIVLFNTGSEIELMQTVLVKICHDSAPNNAKSRVTVRGLMDSGSNGTYITESLAKQLNLKLENPRYVNVSTFAHDGYVRVQCHETKVALFSRDNRTKIHLDVRVIPFIAKFRGRPSLPIPVLSKLKPWEGSLADTLPAGDGGEDVQLLIGCGNYLKILGAEKHEVSPGLFLYASLLGYLLGGVVEDPDSPHIVASNGSNVCLENSLFCFQPGFDGLSGNLSLNSTKTLNGTEPEVHLTCADSVTDNTENTERSYQLERLWALDALGIVDSPSVNDDEVAVRSFENSIEFRNGRYMVGWPWKINHKPLPDNYFLALALLKSLVLKLHNQPDLLKRYNDNIQEQLRRCIIEEVTPDTQPGNIVHYIPHHCVVKEDRKTTKLRTVYNASAKTKRSNPSLNDCLYRGPVILPQLLGILLRFRLYEVVILADIEKAFLNVGLLESERDCTRFLWLRDPFKADFSQRNLIVFRFTAVPFGAISSPFLLAATITHHLRESYHPLSDKILQNMYVDNIITGVNTVTEAVSFYKEVKTLFSQAGFNLREWFSNSDAFLSTIPENDKVLDSGTKVLGLHYDRKNDVMKLAKVDFGSFDAANTKRKVLHCTSLIFDPLGIVGPLTLSAKVFISSLWKQKLQWDTPLSTDNLELWHEAVQIMKYAQDVSVPRYISTHDPQYMLICFCDASQKAYCCVLYLRVYDRTSLDTQCNLLFAKTRVVPPDKFSVPRSELMGVLIGTRSISYARKHLSIPISKTYLFTDSSCVIHWIRSEKQLSVFVRNRINEIKDLPDTEIRHISSHFNPADRGTKVFKAPIDAFWLHGPSFLLEDEDAWPISNSVPPLNSEETSRVLSEVPHKKEVLFETGFFASDIVTCNKAVGEVININDFSSLDRLLFVTAFVLRAVQAFLSKAKFPAKVISAQERCNALKMWLCWTQYAYTDFIKDKLKRASSNVFYFANKDGLIACKTRFENKKDALAHQPLLLPGKSKLVELIITHLHKVYCHAGVSQLLAIFRRNYWVPNARSEIKSILNQCVICKRFESGPYRPPLFKSLPEERLSQTSPFSFTGLDYLGPVQYKHYVGKRKFVLKKVWILLYECLTTRAVHLQLASDLSAETLILLLRQFISRYGCPVKLFSDNAKAFRLTKTTMDIHFNTLLKGKSLQDFAGKIGFSWSFTLPKAAWQGGHWERLIGLVKRCLRKTTLCQPLAWRNLETILNEIQYTINSRPLYYVDNSTMEILTPNHFVLPPTHRPPGIEYSKKDFEDPEFNPAPTSAEKLLSIWKAGTKLTNKFWHLWQTEYLMHLRMNTQSEIKKPNAKRNAAITPPKVDDVVLIYDPNLPRGSWKYGKIVKLIPSSDEVIRGAEVLLPSGKVLSRSIFHLYPLVSAETQDPPLPSLHVKSDKLERPKRKAALTARTKIKSIAGEQLTDEDY